MKSWQKLWLVISFRAWRAHKGRAWIQGLIVDTENDGTCVYALARVRVYTHMDVHRGMQQQPARDMASPDAIGCAFLSKKMCTFGVISKNTVENGQYYTEIRTVAAPILPDCWSQARLSGIWEEKNFQILVTSSCPERERLYLPSPGFLFWGLGSVHVENRRRILVQRISPCLVLMPLLSLSSTRRYTRSTFVPKQVFLCESLRSLPFFLEEFHDRQDHSKQRLLLIFLSSYPSLEEIHR